MPISTIYDKRHAIRGYFSNGIYSIISFIYFQLLSTIAHEIIHIPLAFVRVSCCLIYLDFQSNEKYNNLIQECITILRSR